MTKISALSDIGTSVASNDAFVLVDVSDPTTPNKKIQQQNLFLIPDGSAGTPAVRFLNDTDVGLFRPTTNTLALATGGTERLRITSAGLVGIGTTSPVVPLHLVSNAGLNTPVELFRAGSEGASLRLSITPASAGDVVSEIYAFSGGTGNSSSSALAFKTRLAGVESERARIDSSGRLLIGTSSSADLNASVQSIGTTAYRFYGFRYGSDNGILTLGSANGTQASPSVLTSPNLNLGILQFRSHDGVAYQDGAWIFAVAESQWSSGNCPTRLVFSTTAASASTPTERLRIDSSGRLLVGTLTARENFNNNTSGSSANFQLEGATAASRTGSIVSSNNGTPGSVFILGHQRSGSLGGNGILVANDFIGTVSFQGADGSKLVEAAKIVAEVDGTPGQTAGTFTIGQTYRILTTGTTDFTLIGAADSNPGTTFTATGAGTGTGTAINTAGDMPGRLVFSTTADGASTPTERLRITNDGVKCYDQPAPAAVNATATLTVANLKAGIITSTSAAATDMTLPTGTDTQAGFSGTYDNFTFEWSVINTGPSLVRVLAATAHTIVGSGSVATGTSARFASRRTAANTFVSYRLS